MSFRVMNYWGESTSTLKSPIDAYTTIMGTRSRGADDLFLHIRNNVNPNIDG